MIKINILLKNLYMITQLKYTNNFKNIKKKNEKFNQF